MNKLNNIKLKKIIEDFQLKNEGLIQTHPIEGSLDMLELWCNFNGKIKYDIFDKTKIRAFINNNITEHEFDVLLKYSNNLGYFPCHIYTEDNNYGRQYTTDDIEELINKHLPFTVKFEAKYSVGVETNPKTHTLYHATDKIYLDKILRIGLIPKSKSKLTSHPERIYLTPHKEDAYIFAYNPKSNIKDVVIISVDLNNAKNNIRLFIDPNIKPIGYYTYENIPPICLKKIE